MDKRSKRIKTLILGAFWCLVVVVYIVRLMNLQLVHGDECDWLKVTPEEGGEG